MGERTPKVIVLAGPNGAGKSTTAPALLKGLLGVTEFVNADTIAQGLSAFQPDRVRLAAGRIMLGRIRELAQQRADFAFETTLASRSFAPWIGDLKRDGYEFHIVFLWLPSAEVAVARVAERVRLGGHDVPEGTIRRRYDAGWRNFFALYQPMATTWQLYDNAGEMGPRLVAVGEGRIAKRVLDMNLWKHIRPRTIDG